LAAASDDDDRDFVAFEHTFGDLLFTIHVRYGACQLVAINIEDDGGVEIPVLAFQVAFPFTVEVGGKHRRAERERDEDETEYFRHAGSLSEDERSGQASVVAALLERVDW
ncbi:MAG: hypothetical protein JWN34_735, partial [Bryobacterales bacterium]|nr:hypothetical protein [Bryobacterales bacterium]